MLKAYCSKTCNASGCFRLLKNTISTRSEITFGQLVKDLKLLFECLCFAVRDQQKSLQQYFFGELSDGL